MCSPAREFPERVAARPEPARPPVGQKELSAKSVGSSIEEARDATVSIETPWGVGSGFFISRNCIVTSRHVVKVDPKEPAKYRQMLDEKKKWIDSQKKSIDQLRTDLLRTPRGSVRTQREANIDQFEKKLKDELSQCREAERELEKLEKPIDESNIKVTLADGSSHS